MKMILAMVVFSVLGCGESSSTDVDGSVQEKDAGITEGSGGGLGERYRSGTRIKMKVLTSADGAKQFQGWHDSTRNEDCLFALAADGMTRCVPTSVASTAYNYFSDSLCSVPVAYTLSCAAAPQYIATPPAAQSCALAPSTVGNKYYLRGAVVTAPNVYKKSSATCDAVANNVPAVVYYALGAEVPASEFAAATLAVE